MEQRRNPLKNIKVEVRPSPMLLKIMLTLLIVFSMGTLVALRWVHLEFQEETQKVLAEAAKAEYRQEELSRKIEEIGTVGSIKEIAGEELGLMDPYTVVIQPVE